MCRLSTLFSIHALPLSTLLASFPFPPPYIPPSFKLFTQSGEAAQPTALHHAAQETVWNKTREVLARLK